MGTHMGAIFILDFAGTVVARYRPHTAMVNAISIDHTSDFVATASMDGRHALQSFVDPHTNTAFSLRQSGCAVADDFRALRFRPSTADAQRDPGTQLWQKEY